MTFLPIVVRELLEASRHRSTYWIRLGVVTAGLTICLFVMLLARNGSPGELGLALFVPLAILTYLYTLFIGIFRTADSLSEEKREGTLGLLFLTDLKGYDIVLGKLFATSLNAFYGALAIFPIMAIPVLLGGVAPAEVGRVVLVSVNMMFFSLAVGMFCSSINRDDRKAMVGAFLIILFFLGGIPLVALILHEWRVTRGLQELWKQSVVLSPVYACVMAFDLPARGMGAKNYFTTSVLITHICGWLFLILACVIVPRTWQDKGATTGELKRRQFWNRLAHGSRDARDRLRRRLLAINPVLWLASRDRLKTVLVWSVLGLAALIWAAGLLTHPNHWKDELAYVWTALILHTMLKFWVASEACRRFSMDRQSGALELLLSTPLTVPEIIKGQVLALERQFALPVFLVLLVDFAFLMAGRTETLWLYLVIAGMIVFAADIFTLMWVGMWRGLNSRRPNRAAAAATARILVLPWVLWGMISILLGVFVFRRGGGSDFWEGKFFIVLWAGLSVAVDLFFGLPARQKLLSEFRTVATTRFETKGRG